MKSLIQRLKFPYFRLLDNAIPALLSVTREGQCFTRNLERVDIRKDALGSTGMQQWHKEPRPKGAITSGKQGPVNGTFMETIGLEIEKRIAGSSIRIRKMSVRTLWRGRPPPT
jgi:hypothetical protein